MPPKQGPIPANFLCLQSIKYGDRVFGVYHFIFYYECKKLFYCIYKNVFSALGLNYKDNKKDAKVVVFLHGWGGNMKSFAKVSESLEDFRTINIDLPGFGESKLFENADIYDYAEKVYFLLLELDIRSCSIVAHSFGVRVAIILAGLYDIDINKMVFTGGAGLKPRKSLITYLKIKLYKIVKWFAKKGIIKETRLQKYGSEDYRSLSPEKKKVFIKIVNQHLDYLVPKIKGEVLLVWGKKDKSAPYYMAKRFTKLLSNSGLVTYQNCGHFAYLQKFSDFCRTAHYFLNIRP